jgi:hypothetical protein
MTLLHIAFVTVVAIVTVIFGGLYWLESRRPEARRRTDAPAPHDPPAAEEDQEPRGPQRRDG